MKCLPGFWKNFSLSILFNPSQYIWQCVQEWSLWRVWAVWRSPCSGRFSFIKDFSLWINIGFILIIVWKSNNFRSTVFRRTFVCLTMRTQRWETRKEKMVKTTLSTEATVFLKALNCAEKLSNLQGLPSADFFHSSNDIESEGFSHQKIIPP